MQHSEVQLQWQSMFFPPNTQIGFARPPIVKHLYVLVEVPLASQTRPSAQVLSTYYIYNLITVMG